MEAGGRGKRLEVEAGGWRQRLEAEGGGWRLEAEAGDWSVFVCGLMPVSSRFPRTTFYTCR